MKRERKRGGERWGDGRNDGGVQQRHTVCHIASGDGTGEWYSIVSAVLGNQKKHTTAHRCDTQPWGRPSRAYRALHGCAASVHASRGCRWRPGSFWTVSLNAMSLHVMERCFHAPLLLRDAAARLIGMERCVFARVSVHVCFTRHVCSSQRVWWRRAETEAEGAVSALETGWTGLRDGIGIKFQKQGEDWLWLQRKGAVSLSLRPCLSQRWGQLC